ncbi:MAG: hypothetical protein R3F42_08780 [Pseudomonadota bacterium]
MKNSRSIIVLGVYGSGSSAVAGILHHLGVMMGERLVPATAANPKGHFEDAEFRQLLYRYRQDPAVLQQIHGFIEQRFTHYGLWGIKEPAILEAVADTAPVLTGRDYRIICTDRDTEACVSSYLRKWPAADREETRRRIEWLIERRNSFLQQYAPAVLWVKYDDLTLNPQKHVAEIVDFVFFDDGSGAAPPRPAQSRIHAAVASVDPAMNHHLARDDRFADDPILKKWVNPHYLDPAVIERIRAASRSKPFFKFAVLDDFFNEAMLAAYLEQHLQLEFETDDPGLPYDSSWAKAKMDESLGAELFYHEPWHRLLASYTGTTLEIGAGNTSVKLRKHDPDSKGFWIHTDRTKRKSAVALAALFYLNRQWKEEDGAILQLWAESGRAEPVTEDAVEYHWKDYKERRLEFLNERYLLTTDLVTYDAIRPAELFLIDQVLPEYNRLVVLDFLRDPAYHSVTPGNGRARYAVVQWLM